LAAISVGQREFEQWNLDVSALRCVPSGSKSRHFKRQASQEFWCREAGMVNVGLVSLDGTKVKANASRHKAMSYEYMQKEEERLRKEMAELLARAEATDAAEDDLHGRESRGDELPAELARRESRWAKIREAKKALEEQALAAA
jgi:hypothetical protein